LQKAGGFTLDYDAIRRALEQYEHLQRIVESPLDAFQEQAARIQQLAEGSGVFGGSPLDESVQRGIDALSRSATVTALHDIEKRAKLFGAIPSESLVPSMASALEATGGYDAASAALQKLLPSEDEAVKFLDVMPRGLAESVLDPTALAMATDVEKALRGNWDRVNSHWLKAATGHLTRSAMEVFQSYDMTAAKQFAAFGRSYDDLYAGLGMLAKVPAFLLKLPRQDVEIKTEIVSTFGPDYEADSARSVLDNPEYGHGDVEFMLVSIDPDLVEPLHEAIDAAKSVTKGRVRLVCTALRELCTRVLHITSPDREFRQWATPAARPDLYHDGRPTRNGRILFACRTVNVGFYSAHLTNSMQMTREFFDVLHKGTHTLRPEASDAQLHLMIIDAVHVVRLLLTASQQNR